MSKMTVDIERRPYDAPATQGYYQVVVPAPYSAWSMGFTYDGYMDGDELRAYDESAGYAAACVHIINTLNKNAPHVRARSGPKTPRPYTYTFAEFSIADIVAHLDLQFEQDAHDIMAVLKERYDANTGVTWGDIESIRDEMES